MNSEHLVMGIIGYSKDIEPYLIQILAHYLNESLDLGLSFTNGYFGMYSQEVYDQLSACIGAGWISTTTFIENNRRLTQFNITDKGREVLKQIEGIEPDVMQRIKEIMR
jgi:Fe-S cluster biosynthesis and repair protein YggX